MRLDDALMNFVNILGISIFILISTFHFVQSKNKQKLIDTQNIQNLNNFNQNNKTGIATQQNNQNQTTTT